MLNMMSQLQHRYILSLSCEIKGKKENSNHKLTKDAINQSNVTDNIVRVSPYKIPSIYVLFYKSHFIVLSSFSVYCIPDIDVIWCRTLCICPLKYIENACNTVHFDNVPDGMSTCSARFFCLQLVGNFYYRYIISIGITICELGYNI